MLKLIALALMACLSCRAEAGVIFDNETPGSTGGGYAVGLYSSSTNTWAIGFSFVVPSGSNPELAGASFVASFGGGTNNVNVSLEASSGGLPSSVVESWDIDNVLGSNSAITPLASLSRPQPESGQTYWLIASMADPTTSTSWWWTPSTSGTGGVEADSENGAPFYLYMLPSTYSLGAFAIYSVPEPATWAMTLLGFAGIGLAALARRKQLRPTG